MRKLLCIGIVLLGTGASLAVARSARNSNAKMQDQQQVTPQPPASQDANKPQAPPAQIVPPAATHPGPVIILNPSHGGADTGARGPSGAAEKDIALLFARIIRVELERQGYRVVMTRNDDSNPSYDDRAAVANAHRDALFISIHLGSTGTVGTVRAYYYQFPAWPPRTAGTDGAPQPPPTASGILPWEEAQRPFVEASRHFSEILESDLAQHFSGSPPVPAGVAIRELRSVAATAAAIEISSVAVNDPNSLTGLAQPLATSILRSVQAYRPAAATGAK